MTAEQRSASAKRAASARWGAAVLAGVMIAAPASGQDARAELAAQREKAARAASIGEAGPMVRRLLPPGASTSTRPYLRVEIHQGGLFEPSIEPTQTWLEIACIHDDLQTKYSRTKHGSSLFGIHALVYDADFNLIHDTTETSYIDEAVCNVSFTVDDSFIEMPRSVGREAVIVTLLALSSRGQYIEASKLVYRIIPE